VGAGVIARESADLFHAIRKAGNAAAHDLHGDPREALHQLRMARELGVWFHRALVRQTALGDPLVARKTLSANSRAYPKEDDFRTRLKSARLYGGGERREKTKLILERLEEALKHKEAVATGSLTIEHVMPQTLTAEWRAHLGSSAEEDHEELLHTLGNLTLTSYNAELSNSSFAEKKKLFATSHIELNRHFGELQRWTAGEIEQRAEVLADSALAIWPYFGPVQDAEASAASGAGEVTGTVPKSVRVRESVTPVQSWVDVATATVEGIVALGTEEFERVAASYRAS
jgi:hypothetical protein